jgi:hypothetical protein
MSVYFVYSLGNDNTLNCNILYNGTSLRFIICACCWWEMALNVGFALSFDNWKILREEAWKVNNTKSHITNNYASHRILNGC